MSAPPKTSDQEVRGLARKLLEAGGIENLSMQCVAQAAGVRAPSLYKRFSSRTDLLDAIREDALGELKDSIEKTVRPRAPYQNLERMASAYRMFAKSNPNAYRLIFDESSSSTGNERLAEARLASAAALFRILSDASGKENALLGARTLVAFLHGFVSMELGGAFHFGGDINAAFRFGLRTILDGLLPRDKQS